MNIKKMTDDQKMTLMLEALSNARKKERRKRNIINKLKGGKQNDKERY